jgi:hypothetical protein
MRATANNDNSLIIIMTYSSYSAKAPDYLQESNPDGSAPLLVLFRRILRRYHIGVLALNFN